MGNFRAKFARGLLRFIHEAFPHIRNVISYRGMIIYLPPTVFNPKLTFSTSLILDYLMKRKIEGRVLEIGCGSGAISIFLAKNFGVEVICSERNPAAVKSTLINAKLNDVKEKIKVISGEHEVNCCYDIVIVNPPYLPLDPEDILDINWCGGKDLEFFSRIARLAISKLREDGSVYIVLSSIVRKKAEQIFLSMGIKAEEVALRKTPIDTIFLYRLKKRPN
ncbi:MAG: methyltransferase [Fervidicoccaceae archaeon]